MYIGTQTIRTYGIYIYTVPQKSMPIRLTVYRLEIHYGGSLPASSSNIPSRSRQHDVRPAKARRFDTKAERKSPRHSARRAGRLQFDDVYHLCQNISTSTRLIVIAVVAPVRIHCVVNVIEVILVAVAFAAVIIETVRHHTIRLEILAVLHGIPVVEIAHTAFSNLTDTRKICLPEMIPSRQAYIRAVSSTMEKNTENTQSIAPSLSTKGGACVYPIPTVPLDHPARPSR